jgi:hypothetical protein
MVAAALMTSSALGQGIPAANTPGDDAQMATAERSTISAPGEMPQGSGGKFPAAITPATKAPAGNVNVHRFWDKENDWLFAGIGAMRGLDYASTANFRARGRQEILLTNWVVDNKPLFAGIEAATAGASIGVSYIFHRTGHHRLERWVSFVHIGVTGFGVVRNYSLRSVRPHVRTTGDGSNE